MPLARPQRWKPRSEGRGGEAEAKEAEEPALSSMRHRERVGFAAEKDANAIFVERERERAGRDRAKEIEAESECERTEIKKKPSRYCQASRNQSKD